MAGSTVAGRRTPGGLTSSSIQHYEELSSLSDSGIKFRNGAPPRRVARGGGEEESTMEPEMSDTKHMKFVDGRCGCCPYGFHVDIDFLRFLDADDSNLSDLKKLNKKKNLRKSMEVYLQQRGEGAEPMSREEREAVERIMEQIDRTTTTEFTTFEGHERGERKPHGGRKYRTVAELTLSHPEGLEGYESSSSLSISSEPQSPAQTHTTSTSFELGHRPGGRGHTEINTTTTVTTETWERTERERREQQASRERQERVEKLQEQLRLSEQQHQKLPPGGKPKPNYPLTSDEIEDQMAVLLPTGGRVRNPQEGSDTDDGGGDGGGSMTRISSATLQAIREQVTASLQRLRELEEQNKAIPVLQVRVAVLKEEKKMLANQLKNRPGGTSGPFDPDDPRMVNGTSQGAGHHDIHNCPYYRSKPSRTIGIGEGDVFATDTATTSMLVNSQMVFGGSAGELRIGSDGVPVRFHEKELNVEQNTEIREKEVRTVFISGAGKVVPDVIDGMNRPVAAPKPTAAAPLKQPKVPTRSIGVGSGNVFDTSGSNFEVHEKELRTVYIGGSGGARPGRSTRNVGILCKPAMRDVGMVHFSDHEKPMSRNIAVGCGEIGVGVGEGSGYFGEGYSSVYVGGEGGGGGAVGVGGEQPTIHMMNTAMNQMNMAAFQTRHVHVKNEQIRSIIDELLKKEIRSVETQCRFATEDKGTDAGRVNYDVADVGVSDDTIDVDVVPKRVMKSVAIDNRPSLFHRSCGTDQTHKFDQATNTSTQGLHTERATNTEKLLVYPAATNTEALPVHTSATSTEVAMFIQMRQLINAGTDAGSEGSAHASVNTDICGEVDARSDRPKKSDCGTITAGLISFAEKGIMTAPKQSHDKSIATMKQPQNDRAVNTEKPRVSVASVNTDRVKFADSTTSQQTVSAPQSIAQSTRDYSSTSSTTESSGRGSDSLSMVHEPRIQTTSRTKTVTITRGRDGVRTMTTEETGSLPDRVLAASGDTQGKTSAEDMMTSSSGIKTESSSSSSSAQASGRGSSTEGSLEGMLGGGGTTSSSKFKQTTIIRDKDGVRTMTEESGTMPGWESRRSGDGGVSSMLGGGSTSSSSHTKTVRMSGSSHGESMEDMMRGMESDMGGMLGGGMLGGSSGATTTTKYKHTKIISDKDGVRTVTEESGAIPETWSEVMEWGSDGTWRGTGVLGGSGTSFQQNISSRSSAEKGSSSADIQPKSIMKTHSETETRGSSKKGISFSDDVTESFSLAEGDSISGSEGGGSHGSLCQGDEEQQGGVHEGEIADTPESDWGLDSGAELVRACETFDKWLQDSNSVSSKEMNASRTVIQQAWFTVSGQKDCTVDQVEDFLSTVRQVSPHLVEQVINLFDENGNTTLHYAVSHANTDVVSLILDTGCCDINRRNHIGYTASMLATRAELKTDLQFDVVRRLFEAGDINMKSIKGGETALMLAARHGQVEMVKLLLDTGAQVNLQDDDGSTALMGAAENGYADITKVLLDHPDIDASLADHDGSTAMSIAMEAGHREVGVLLYAHVNFKPGAVS